MGEAAPDVDRSRTWLLVLVVLASFSPFVLRGSLQPYVPVILASGVALLYHVRRPQVLIARPILLVAPYVVWVLVSFAANVGSFDAIPPAFAFSLGSVVTIAACVVFAQWLVTSVDLRNLLHPVAVFGTVVAGIPIAVWVVTAVGSGSVTTSLSVQDMAVLRGVGSLYRLQNYGAMLLLTSMATVVHLETRTVGWYVALGAQLLALHAVGARSTILGLAVFAVVYLLLRQGWTRLVRVTVTAAVPASLVVVLAYFAPGGPVEDVLKTSAFNALTTGRGFTWLAARGAGLDNFWFGFGFRNYVESMTPYYAEIGAPAYVRDLGPHNTFLRAMLATGVPGMVFLLTIVYSFVLYGVRSGLDRFQQQFYFAAVGGLLAYGTFESLLFGGMSARSFLFTLFLIAGFWSFVGPAAPDLESLLATSQRDPDSDGPSNAAGHR